MDVDVENPIYDSRNNCGAIIKTEENILLYGCSNTIIPDGVTSIADYAFYGQGISTISLPSSVIRIEQSAFEQCTALKKVSFDSDFTYYKRNWVETWDTPILEYKAADYLRFVDIFGEQVEEYQIGSNIKNLSGLFYGSDNLKTVTINCEEIDNWFNSLPSITTIKLGNNIKIIGDNAFSNCTGLASINIPDGVTTIGENSFSYCSSLQEISIPQSVTSIGQSAFRECENLTKIILDNNNIVSKNRSSSESIKDIFGDQVQKYVLGENVKVIGKNAFNECSKMESITIPKSLTQIEHLAFFGCYGLKKVIISDLAAWCNITFKSRTEPSNTSSSNPHNYAKHIYSNDNTEIKDLVIPEGVTDIASDAFSYCSSLTSVTLPTSLKSIYFDAFEGCDGLQKVVTPEIGAWCNIKFGNFYSNPLHYAKKLYVDNILIEKVELPEGIEEIKQYAFRKCINIKSIKLPSSIKAINLSAFDLCSNLTDVNIPENTETIGDKAFNDCASLRSILLPNSIKSIGASAFSGCSSLSTFAIPENITVINTSTFSGCRGLESIVIPETVTTIGGYAFYGCSNLISVSIPESVTDIGNSTFAGCSTLTSVNIPRGVTSIGKNAFSACDNLKKVNISDISAWCGIVFGDETANPLHFAKHLYNNDEEITNLVIPEGVTTIGDHAFNGCSGLVSISIPESIENVGNATFAGCTGLSSVLINCPSVVSWFSGNTSIQELTFGDKVSQIGDAAFQACSGLTSVNISGGVTNIGKMSFAECVNLNKVNVSDITAWCGINFGDEMANPLHFAKRLFMDGEEVETLVIPNGTNGIGAYAFDACESLTSVVIPNTVKTIGANAFRDCINLRAVTSLIDIPFKLDDSAFIYSNIDYPENTIYMIATLYVPRGRETFYGQTDGWKNFAKVEVTDTKYKLVYMLDGEVYKTYEIQATEMITPEPDPYKEGYIFSGWSDIPYLMPAQDVTVIGSFEIDPVAVKNVSTDDVVPVEYYSLDGNHSKSKRKGVNIVRMSDGTVRKFMVK